MYKDIIENMESIDEVFNRLSECSGKELIMEAIECDKLYRKSCGIFKIGKDRDFNLFHNCYCGGFFCQLVGQGNYGITRISTLDGSCIYSNIYIGQQLNGKEMVTLKFGIEAKRRYEKYLEKERAWRDLEENDPRYEK